MPENLMDIVKSTLDANSGNSVRGTLGTLGWPLAPATAWGWGWLSAAPAGGLGLAIGCTCWWAGAAGPTAALQENLLGTLPLPPYFLRG